MKETFRGRLERKYRKYRAVQILTNAVVGESRRALDHELENIRRLPTSQLKVLARAIERNYDAVMKRYGVVADLESLEQLVTYDGANPHTRSSSYAYISKSALLAALPNFGDVHPTFALLPPHARLAIDVFGIRRGPQHVEVVILEAVLHEDLATLWNAALDAAAETDGKSGPRLIKHRNALLRAAAKAAFSLIEGYINGLALDVVLLQKAVSADQMMLLSEYDAEKQRARPVALREKLLQYPKIAIGARHPPIQESSSKPLSTVVELEKLVRHALMHPNALVDSRKPDQFREIVVLTLGANQVAELCDAVVSLIADIASVVGADFGDVSGWLIPRGSDGRFPDALFA